MLPKSTQVRSIAVVEQAISTATSIALALGENNAGMDTMAAILVIVL